MNNKENIDDFVNPFTLNWEKYPSFDQIKSEPFTVTYFLYPKDELPDSILNDCKIWFDKIGYSAYINSKQEWDILEISDKHEKIGFMYYLLDCLIIRHRSKNSSLMLNFMSNNQIFQVDFFAQIPHIESEEKIGDYTIKYKTGIFNDDSELLPKTFFHLTYNNQLLGKAILDYFVEGFGLYCSTLLMFEIEKEFRKSGFGKLLLQFIEKKMKDYGFGRLYLLDTQSLEFWKKMKYEIDFDINDGWKDL